ncbi:neuronal PAS domain-containing protein 4A-like isoform X2 [Paramormyrops kingsleyae]|uniref:neuronal PAS domain-containing protein 4A-like isoform X2 n=1 Tax=Paramormyrops kingsleyae TaxID=1676925 RepID=UPI003B972F7C
MYRSTKGASKARRDQINAEIRSLKELLPISDADKARLSYLHIMSLACMYTRKSVFFSEAAAAGGYEGTASFMSFEELSELVHGLPGFLLLLTSEGKLLYLSDSVAEHLGHSMVDLVAQGDSVYDIIDPSDHFVMRSNLVPTTAPDTDRLFRCRFNTSKSVRRQSAGTKLALIRARCLSPPSPASSYWTSNPVWMCFCSPLEAQPLQPCPSRSPTLTPPADHAFFLACFHSQHGRDMRLQEAQDSINVYLGYDVETLRTHSWYSLLHPEDLSHASAQHCRLLSEGGEGRVEMVVRMEAADHTWVWLYMVLTLEGGDSPISCHNYVISESEAWSVRQQLCTEQNQLALVLSASASYQHSLGLQSPDTLSSPDQVFTPSSSGLSAQSFDFSSGAEQAPGGGAELAQPEGGHPRSSLSSLEEESFPQQSQPPSQQQQPPRPGDAATPPPPASSPAQGGSSDPMSDFNFLAQSIFLSPPLQTGPRLPVIPLSPPPQPASHPHQGKESVCTPPYTPQLGGGGFVFGDQLFSMDTNIGETSTVAPPVAMPTPLTTPHTLSISAATTDLLFSKETCAGPFYEKLPPTPDTPGDGDCTIMTLPEVRGPLFVDVPSRPFPYPHEGLLTPEASPGEQTCQPLFSLDGQQDKERIEISLLAQHISSLAERFYPEGIFHKLMTSSPTSPRPPTPAQDFIPPMFELYPVKCWRSSELSLSPDDIALIEECIIEALLQDLSSSSPSPSPCHSSPPPSPPMPECWCPPPQFEGASLVGLGHICSVQSAHCNLAAGGGATAGTDAEAANGEGEIQEGAMEVEASPSPPCYPSATSSVLASPLIAPAVPVASPSLLRAQPLPEELAAVEPVFGAGASIAPALGQQPELYQLHCRSPPRDFQAGEKGSTSAAMPAPSDSYTSTIYRSWEFYLHKNVLRAEVKNDWFGEITNQNIEKVGPSN